MYNLGTSFRSKTPEQTLKKITPFLKDPFEITRIANISYMDDLGVPIYAAIRPMGSILAINQGKALDHEAAKVSALMEAIEYWHADHIRDPDCYASQQELVASGKKVFSYQLMPRKDITYNNYDNRKRNWFKAINLIDNNEIWISQDVVDLHVAQDRSFQFVHNHPNTNGLASGNTREEAILHGILEAIERDDEARCLMYDYPTERIVNIESIQNPILLKLIESLTQKDVTIVIIDVTGPMQIPSFQVLINDENRIRNLGLTIGAGCHLDADIALVRAITEAIQARVTVLHGARDNMYPKVYQRPKASINYLMDNSINKCIISKTLYTPKSIADAVDYLIKRLQQFGIDEIICFDHTREEFGIPVTHMIIPKLRFEFNKHIYY